ncbi:hypothetical protein CPB84DRAFT_1771951 [Gymnopilus junonius]|uniref:Uncharacterized protein n=1 Tax=Gymnopilus junonius TaxID=109634 RepID=A0A9P5NVD7_GYMJU|nr:hypothetical protein CPB84DRAFT_1771951 [Gymnopilus junonius]
MMKFVAFATTVLLAAAGIVKANNCTSGLDYCDHSLIAKGNYQGQLDRLYQDVLDITVTSTDGNVWNGDLFTCVGGRSAVVKHLQACPNGLCNDNGNGKSDTCA